MSFDDVAIWVYFFETTALVGLDIYRVSVPLNGPYVLRSSKYVNILCNNEVCACVHVCVCVCYCVRVLLCVCMRIAYKLVCMCVP